MVQPNRKYSGMWPKRRALAAIHRAAPLPSGTSPKSRSRNHTDRAIEP